MDFSDTHNWKRLCVSLVVCEVKGPREIPKSFPISIDCADEESQGLGSIPRPPFLSGFFEIDTDFLGIRLIFAQGYILGCDSYVQEIRWQSVPAPSINNQQPAHFCQAFADLGLLLSLLLFGTQ